MCYSADAAGGDYKVCSPGKLSRTYITFSRTCRVTDRSSWLFVQESQYWFSMVYPQVVGVVNEVGIDPSFFPVATIDGHESAIVAGVIGLVSKSVFEDTDGRCHACPGATQILRCFTLN